MLQSCRIPSPRESNIRGVLYFGPNDLPWQLTIFPDRPTRTRQSMPIPVEAASRTHEIPIGFCALKFGLGHPGRRCRCFKNCACSIRDTTHAVGGLSSKSAVVNIHLKDSWMCYRLSQGSSDVLMLHVVIFRWRCKFKRMDGANINETSAATIH